MKTRIFYLGILGSSWILALTIPHFQTDPTSIDFLVDGLIGVLLFNSLGKVNSIFFANGSPAIQRITLGVLGIFPVVYSLLQIGWQFPYKIWNRLGAGSMKLNGEIIPFGDLIHITSAAKCQLPINVGNVACDLWGRPLNQNPHIVHLAKALHLTNIEFVGIISYFVFALVIYFVSRNMRVRGLWVPLFLLSAPVTLAMDRGNELITVSLILVAMVLMEKKSILFSAIGAICLLISAIFKLWPIILVMILLLFERKVLRPHILVILGLSIGYWTLNYGTAFELLDATQHGSVFGNSFGLKLFWNSHLEFEQKFCLLFVCVVAFYFFQRGPIYRKEVGSNLAKARFGYFLYPIFLTYIAIWIAGDSFSYRAIILLPAVLILSQRDLFGFAWSQRLLQIIVFTLVTARLPIFSAITSATAIFLATFITINFTATLRHTSHFRA